MNTSLNAQKRTFHLVDIQKQHKEKPQLFADEPELLPVRRAAELVGVSPKTLRHLITGGAIPGCRIGRSFFIPRSDLVEYITGGGGLHA